MTRMMTESVITQSANFFGTMATGSKSIHRSNSDISFDTFLGGSITGKQEIETTMTSSPKHKPAGNSNVEKGKASSLKKDNHSSTEKQKVLNHEKSKVTNEGKETKSLEKTEVSKKASSTESKTLAEDVNKDDPMVEVLTMLQAVQELVMEILNLTSEELQGLMEEQGMEITDLLDPNSLRQLLLTSRNETDISAFLMNEDLVNTLELLTQQVDQIFNEASLGLSREELEDVLQKLDETITAEEPEVKEVIITNQDLLSKTKNDMEDEGKSLAADRLNQGKVHQTEDKTQNWSVSEETVSSLEQDTESFNNQDNPLDAKEQFHTFVDHMVASYSQTQVDELGNVYQYTQIRDIANQIIEKIKILIKPETTSMEMQLNPEHLGKVNLTVESKNGIMTAHFTVQNEISKEAIESQLVTLKENLDQQGLKVEVIEVTVSNNTYGQGNQAEDNHQPSGQKSSTGRRISLEEAMAMEELPSEDSASIHIAGVSGSQIDYTA